MSKTITIEIPVRGAKILKYYLDNAHRFTEKTIERHDKECAKRGFGPINIPLNYPATDKFINGYKVLSKQLAMLVSEAEKQQESIRECG